MVLLDSHAVLWLADDPGRLGSEARRRLSQATQRYVSSVTQVEFRIKAMTGGFAMPARLFDSLEAQGLTPLSLTHEHAAAMVDFPELARHDPFDRLLLAQAHVERLSFLTADRHLLALGLEWLVDARA